METKKKKISIEIFRKAGVCRYNKKKMILEIIGCAKSEVSK